VIELGVSLCIYLYIMYVLVEISLRRCNVRIISILRTKLADLCFIYDKFISKYTITRAATNRSCCATPTKKNFSYRKRVLRFAS